MISLRYYIPIFLILLWPGQISATHNVSAEISCEFTSANTIRATIITYTKISSTASRDSLLIHWGDNTPDNFIAVTGPGVAIGNGIKRNIYTGSHTYTSLPQAPDNFYIISFTDPNRNSDIININNSVNVPFYVEDSIWFQGQGLDHTPLLLYPPVDFANIGDTFFHNPTAYDIEADSLTFELVQPRVGPGNVVPGYISPEQVIAVAGDSLTIDRLNGMLTWAVPRRSGVYDIAILIREYRDGIILSTTTRDMVIIVRADTSHPAPLNGNFSDTVISTGQFFQLTCTAADADPAHINTLASYGGPFLLNPDSAVFSSVPANQPTGSIAWTPGHNLFKKRETYIITVRAQISDSDRLTTLRSFRLTVEDSLHVGITSIPDSHGFVKIYPDPAQDIVNISSGEDMQTADVYSSDGEAILHKNINRVSHSGIDTRELPPGCYILAAKDVKGASYYGRFMILR